MQVVAVRLGGGSYLVATSEDDDRRGRILNADDGTVSEEITVEGILAHGYWQNPRLTPAREAELVALVEAALAREAEYRARWEAAVR